MRGGFLILISVSFFLFTIFAVASESSLLLDQAMRNEDMNASIEFRKISISTGESFRKTQLVYQIFGIPPEADYQPELDLLVPTTSPEYVSTLLKSLDPSNQFGRFFDKSENALNGFRDRDEKKQIEFKLALASRELPAKPQMNGIRIAIDPGHMGGTDWDQRTGKFVRGEKNLYLSEGILNLITTHLLAEKLREKGAQVMITHEDAGPVSEMKYEELNLREFAKKELRSRSLSDWFLALLQGNSDQNLEAAFSNANAVKKLNSEIMRSDYYTMREDLYARTAKIKEFKPDLTLFIHFDADKPNPDPKFRNITRAYVPGAFGQS